MSTAAAPSQAPIPSSADDPFRLGWRYVGAEQVPLTEDDVLHPQEGDFIMENLAHDVDRAYLRDVAKARVQGWARGLVLCDCRVDWEVEGIRPHGPDLVLFDGVDLAGLDPDLGTFYVAKEGARPLLVMEITSPSTRENDLGIKVQHYHTVGVPLYVIVDRDPKTGAVELIGYQRTPRRYLRMALDEQGRLWLEPLGLWLGTKDNHAVCYDGATEEELGDYTALAAALAESRTALAASQADLAASQADLAAARSDLAAKLVELEAERQARLSLDARLRELESRRNGPDA